MEQVEVVSSRETKTIETNRDFPPDVFVGLEEEVALLGVTW